MATVFDIGTSDFMLEAWIKVPSTISDAGYIIGKKSITASEAGYLLRINANGTLEGEITQSGGTDSTVITSSAYHDNQVHHVVFVADRDTSLKIYVDGAEASYGTQEDPSGIGSLDNTNDLEIGSRGGEDGFVGLMTEIRLWKFSSGVPSSISDIISDHYKYPCRLSSLDSTSDLVARYVTQADGLTLLDVSGNGNNLNFSSTPVLDYQSIGPNPQQTKRTADGNYHGLVKKFVGHTVRFEIDRKNKDSDIIRCVCRGTGTFLKETLNINYPNKWDYWTSEFGGLEFTSTRPDGIAFPTTYDGWPIDTAFKSILTRGHIDPTLLIKRNLYLNNASVIVSGAYLIEPSKPTVVLEKARNYGNSKGVFEFEAVDDEYRQKSNFGDLLFDYVNDIVEPYGWEWGINPYYDGAPYLRARNNPSDIVSTEHSDVTLNGSWSDKNVNLDAISGTYRETSTATDYVEYVFQGQRLDIVNVLRSSNGGGQVTVASGTSTTRFSAMQAKGDSLAVGNRLIFELPNSNETSLISSSPSSNEYIISPALSEIPPSGTLVRTAGSYAEIRRGSSWPGNSEIIASGWMPSYFEHGLDSILPSNRINTNPIEERVAVSGTKRFYYHGLEPRDGINPTVFNIGTGFTRDDHIIRITRVSDAEANAGTVFGWNAFFVYDRDRSFPIHTYRTGDSVASGTLLELSVLDSGEDERNDVIVVGRRIGSEVPGGFADRPVNPNNPEGKFIASRAIDLGSIYNNNAKNFVGRPTQSILIEPGIGSQDRADYWAVSFLNRFRFTGRQADFRALADPRMEVGDCILIDDENKSTIDQSNKIWIEGVSSTHKQSEALMNIETTSYEPYASYVPKVEVSVADFDNSAFDNVTITNGGSADTPYDPYSLDEDGTIVTITFDLVLTGYLRVEVFSHNGAKVADLLNPEGEDGKQGYMRETAGSNKKVTWDGVDLVGSWNENKIPDAGDGKNFFVVEDVNLKNSSGQTYGKFYLYFTLEADDGTPYYYDSSSDSALEGHNYIYTRRGDQIAVTGSDSPSFVAASSPSEATPPTGFTSADNTNRGLQIQFNVTNSEVRPALLNITYSHVIVGRVIATTSTIATDRPRRRNTIPQTLNINDLSDKLSASDGFVDYSTQQTYYFDPAKVLNVVYEDWVRFFGYDAEDPSSFNPEEILSFIIGHYFLLTFTLTDKSGRSAEVTVPHVWFKDGQNIALVDAKSAEIKIGDENLGFPFGSVFSASIVGRRRR